MIKATLISAFCLCSLTSCSGFLKAGYQFEAAWEQQQPEEKPSGE